jgi:hypothetical protein
MAVVSNHLNATLRFTDATQARNHVQSLHRVRPNIEGSQVEAIIDAIQQVRAQQIGGASMTVQTELSQEDPAV